MVVFSNNDSGDSLKDFLDDQKYPYKSEAIDLNDNKVFYNSCNDKIASKIVLDGSIVANINWNGKVCLVSHATANYLAAKISNKEKAQAIDFIKNLDSFLMSEEEKSSTYAAFNLLKMHKSRIKCAEIVIDSFLDNLIAN